ncbi:2-dehydro-3-deoxygalactonokinase [Glutamicibacter ardleyensis]|uniref:2-dehydro-3-deoxygalactonokinase n=1 Tax=Glutamicibacter ardleyensis TaxID=225894 RepID=UPI003FD381DF
MTNMAEAQLIALDWGTTSARAYLMGHGGEILAERSKPLGIMQVNRNAEEKSLVLEVAFGAAFEELCGDWSETLPLTPIIACGMVGSRQGWIEAAYRPAPADLSTQNLELATVEVGHGQRLHVIPGVLDSKELPDVMRGEETQILGALDLDTEQSDSEDEQLFLLPGTHSKWVRVKGQTIIDFSTSMTGETFALLSKHSILSKLMDPATDENWNAFDRGVRVSRSSIGSVDVMLTAFSARTLVLTGRLERTEVSDYLSGLMIGSEIRSVIERWKDREVPALTICGNQELNKRYARALALFDVQRVRELQGTAARGLWSVASTVGLLQASSV